MMYLLSDELLISGSLFPVSVFSLSIFRASQGRIVDASFLKLSEQWLPLTLLLLD